METRLALTDFNIDDIATAVSMRIAYIETGNVTLRAADAIKCGKQDIVKPLTESQRDIILRMENMLKRILSEQSKQSVSR